VVLESSKSLRSSWLFQLAAAVALEILSSRWLSQLTISAHRSVPRVVSAASAVRIFRYSRAELEMQ